MVTLHGIGGVDQTADLFWKLEEGCQFFPVVLPGLDRCRIFVFPGFLKLEQIGFSFFASSRLVDRFQIGGKGFLIFPSHVFQRIADLVDNATLYLSLGKDRMDGIGKTSQAVHRCDENIGHAAILQACDHRKLEIRSFPAIADPMT